MIGNLITNANSTTTEIIEKNIYYPFGLKHKGYNSNITGRDHNYGFGGKEEQDELGLGWIDITARNYDPALGRWFVVDALADAPEQIDKSPYQYAWNNPIYYNDPDGNCPECPDEVYLPIADHVYDATEGSSVNGWTVVEGGIFENPETGFKGALYQGSGEWEGQFIFATAGTDDLADVSEDLKQIFGASKQYKKSVGIASGLKDKYAGVSFTGHSLGGGLASANALTTEGKAVTFNAAGLSGSTRRDLELAGNTANISAYVVQGEAVSYYESKIRLKRGYESKVTTFPASYVPRIPGTKVDDLYRTYQRGKNHTVGVMTEKFNQYKKK